MFHSAFLVTCIVCEVHIFYYSNITKSDDFEGITIVSLYIYRLNAHAQIQIIQRTEM